MEMEYAEILHRCFRCGYCKFPDNYTDLNCPSYLKFRFETYSPGGRMWLLRGLLNGDLSPSARMQEILFSCATCGNCVEHCAMTGFKDKLLMAFTAGKEMLVQAGHIPPSLRDYLTPLQTHGNPYKQSPGKRDAWVNGSNVEPFTDQEYLFFIGDVGSYDPRGQAMARSVADLLNYLNVSFGILGSREVSDGNDARAAGERDLFEYLAAKNINHFQETGVSKIITLSPHGFHALKNEYPLLGGRFQVFHYTQLLSLLFERLHFRTEQMQPVRICYHDPCYLGRHNHEFFAARSVLSRLPGVTLVEMDRNMKNALCCGGGGANFFTDILGSGKDAPANARVREAADTGAQILAVACPLCANMLEDAIRVENMEDRLQVKEVSEIVSERLISENNP